MEDVSPELPSGRSRGRLVPVAVLGLVALSAVAFVAFRFLSTESVPQLTESVPQPTASGSGIATKDFGVVGIGCGWIGDEPDKDFCRRVATDSARRQPPSSEDELMADAVAVEVSRAIGKGGQHGERQSVICDSDGGCRIIDREPGPADADRVRVELTKAGHTGIVIRIATPTDPAPRGALLYAVPVGRSCLVGYTKGVHGGTHELLGRLPGGTCL